MSVHNLKNSDHLDYTNPDNTPTPEKLLNNIQGCILGAAIGDAVGVPYEVFGDYMWKLKKKTAIPFKSATNGYTTGTHHVPKGTWSDDTSMGLCLAMSMIKNNDFNQNKCAEWFASWLEEGTLSSMDYTWGVGQMTHEVMKRFVMFKDVEKAHETLKSRPTNGCVMRNFPVACYFWESLPDAINASQKQTEITNWGPECELAIAMSCLQTEIIWKCLRNNLLAEKKDLLTIVKSAIDNQINSGNKHVQALSDVVFNYDVNESTPPFYVGSSFTAMTYAVYGLVILDTIEKNNEKTALDPKVPLLDPYIQGLDQVIRMGGDTDTNGCIYGGMAGAYLGYAKLPEHLKEGVVYRTFLEKVAESLVTKTDLVTGKFKTNYDAKFLPNSAPKHIYAKPRPKRFFRGGISMNMLEQYMRMLNGSSSSEDEEENDKHEEMYYPADDKNDITTNLLEASKNLTEDDDNMEEDAFIEPEEDDITTSTNPYDSKPEEQDDYVHYTTAC